MSDGNKKHGRQAKRSASHLRYTQAQRWVTNKARRIAKEKRRQAACAKVRAMNDTPIRDVCRQIRKLRRAA